MIPALTRATLAAALVVSVSGRAQGQMPYVPVVTPNGSTLPFVMGRGVKVFHLIAEQVERELAPGMVINAWGYNGQTPEPTIEAVEGDRVRILVTNQAGDSVSLWKAADLTPIGTFSTAPNTHPSGVASDDINFWITLPGTGAAQGALARY